MPTIIIEAHDGRKFLHVVVEYVRSIDKDSLLKTVTQALETAADHERELLREKVQQPIPMPPVVAPPSRCPAAPGPCNCTGACLGRTAGGIPGWYGGCLGQ